MTDLEKLILDTKNNDIKIEVKFEVKPIWRLPIVDADYNIEESIKRNQIQAKFRIFSYEMETLLKRLIEDLLR